MSAGSSGVCGAIRARRGSELLGRLGMVRMFGGVAELSLDVGRCIGCGVSSGGRIGAEGTAGVINCGVTVEVSSEGIGVTDSNGA